MVWKNAREMTYKCPTSRKETDKFEMTQAEVAEKLFLNTKTVMATERRAIEKIRKLFAERNIKSQDILED